MANLNVNITQPQIKRGQVIGNRTFVVELDADRFERLAGDFGFFNPDFLKSLDKSERQYKKGKVKNLKSLRELRKP